MRKLIVITAGSALALVITGSAWAQQQFAYPAKGQSQQQQNNDTGQCQVWAQQQTGVNPAAVAQQASNQPPPPQPQGERVRGAVGGALIGGAIGGSDGAGTGAVVGMVAGGSRQRQKQRSASQQQQAQQQQAQGQISTYNRAFAACMEGRGYSMR